VRGSRSETGTRPRWRSGAAIRSSRRSAPSTGTPSGSTASRRICSWTSEPIRLKITPATSSSGSKLRKPWTIAAAERAIAEPSTTSTTGARSSFATCAVEASSPRPVAPSNSPITPSITATSASAAPWRKSGAISSAPARNASRLRPGRPDASAW